VNIHCIAGIVETVLKLGDHIAIADYITLNCREQDVQRRNTYLERELNLRNSTTPTAVKEFTFKQRFAETPPKRGSFNRRFT
jgi:hypothetical protein